MPSACRLWPGAWCNRATICRLRRNPFLLLSSQSEALCQGADAGTTAETGLPMLFVHLPQMADY